MFSPKKSEGESAAPRLKLNFGGFREGVPSAQSLNSKSGTDFQEEFKRNRLFHPFESGSVNSKSGMNLTDRISKINQLVPTKRALELTPNFASDNKRPMKLQIDFSSIENAPSQSSMSMKGSSRLMSTGSDGLFVKKNFRDCALNAPDPSFSDLKSDLLNSERKFSEVSILNAPKSREFKVPCEAPPTKEKFSGGALTKFCLMEEQDSSSRKVKAGLKKKQTINNMSLQSESASESNNTSNEENSFVNDDSETGSGGKRNGSLLQKFLKRNPEFKDRFYDFIISEKAERPDDSTDEDEDEDQRKRSCIKQRGSSYKKTVQFQNHEDFTKQEALFSERDLQLLRGGGWATQGKLREDATTPFEDLGNRITGTTDLRNLFQKQKTVLDDILKEKDDAVKHGEELEIRNAELTKLLSKLTMRFQGLTMEDRKLTELNDCQARLSSDSNSSQVQMKFIANLNEENLKKYKEIFKKTKAILRVRNKSEIVNCVEELSRRAKWQKKLIKNLWKLLQINTVNEDSGFGTSRKLEIEEARGVEIEAKVRALIEQNKILRRNASALTKKNTITGQPGISNGIHLSAETEEAKQRESYCLEERLQRIKTILDK